MQILATTINEEELKDKESCVFKIYLLFIIHLLGLSGGGVVPPPICQRSILAFYPFKGGLLVYDG